MIAKKVLQYWLLAMKFTCLLVHATMQRAAALVNYSLKIFVTLAAGLTGNQWRGEVFEEKK
jgi:hypothetical protein